MDERSFGGRAWGNESLSVFVGSWYYSITLWEHRAGVNLKKNFKMGYLVFDTPRETVPEIIILMSCRKAKFEQTNKLGVNF